jgi:hypothetical protein
MIFFQFSFLKGDFELVIEDACKCRRYLLAQAADEQHGRACLHHLRVHLTALAIIILAETFTCVMGKNI